MKLRILVGALLIPIAVWIILLGGLPLRITLFILSLISTFELFRALQGHLNPLNYISFLAIGVYYFLVTPTNYTFFIFVIGWLISNLTTLVFYHDKFNSKDVLINIATPLYPMILLSTIYYAVLFNPRLAWIMFLSAWSYDSFAYFTGKLIGKHKFTPKLSPNKTIEGFIGGIIGAMLVCYIYFVFVIDFTQMNAIIFSLLSGIIAVFGQIGDLAASSIKRHCGIKDFGHIIPGHGGIMDRFDSLMFTAPLTFILILFFHHLSI